MSAREYPARCPICFEELLSDDEVVQHVALEIRRAEERLAAAALARAEQEAIEAETTPAAPHSLGRLFDQRIGAHFALDPYQLVSVGREQLDAMRERIEETLWRQLVRYVEPWGVDLRRESVYVRSEERFLDPVPTLHFEATWSPDPLRGCQFRGGPVDGEVMALARMDDLGRPIRYVVRAAYAPERSPFRRPFGPEESPAVRLATTEVRYRLAGIDPDVDQWVYAWQP